MKPFMSNPCMHPHCKDVKCEKCFFYQPAFYGIRVPKKVGTFLFGVENFLFRLEKRFFEH
jgi:hypothetical protein